VGTANGMLRFDGDGFEHFYPEKLRKATVTRLAGDAYSLWVGTYNSGVYLYRKGVWKQFGTEQGLADTLVTDLYADGPDLLVATPAGIQRLADGKFEFLLRNAFVQSICRWGDDVWAATQDRGLARIPARAGVRRPGGAPAPSLPDSDRAVPLLRRIGNGMAAFARGKAWTMSEGQRWKPWLDSGSPLSDANISSLLRASNGDLWVGYFDRGLDVLDANFQQIRRLQDDVFFCINYISQDAAGNVYVSTANGLAVVKPDGSRRVYRTADGLLSDRVMQAVPLDAQGKRVAIATAQGFTLMEDGQLKSLYAFHGLVNNHVYSIAADDDQIYVGTLGGISRIRNMQVVSSWTQMDSGLRRNWVNALLAVDHKLLVGTYGSGIQERGESGDWSAFSQLPETFEVNPNAFFFDGRYVFCGTLDRGAYVYDTRNNAWKQLRSRLPGPNVTAFARAGSFLLVATDRGLLQVSYDEINTIPDLR
jgi:ligand-binding sensor domain-containing protein